MRDFSLPPSCKLELCCLGILRREKVHILPDNTEQPISPMSRAKRSKQKLPFYAAKNHKTAEISCSFILHYRYAAEFKAFLVIIGSYKNSRLSSIKKNY